MIPVKRAGQLLTATLNTLTKLCVPRKTFAAAVGMEYGHLTSYAGDGHNTSALANSMNIIAESARQGARELIDATCQEAGGVFVAIPAELTMQTDLQTTGDVAAHAMALLADYHAARADGVVTEKEADDYDAMTMHVVSMLLAKRAQMREAAEAAA